MFALCVLAGVLLETVVGEAGAVAFVAVAMIYGLVRYAARQLKKVN